MNVSLCLHLVVVRQTIYLVNKYLKPDTLIHLERLGHCEVQLVQGVRVVVLKHKQARAHLQLSSKKHKHHHVTFN